MIKQEVDKLILDTGNGILEYLKNHPNLSEDERGEITNQKMESLYEIVKEHFDSFEDMFIYLNELVRWERIDIKGESMENPYHKWKYCGGK